ncbi:MAG TPA: CPBP family intramembrane metalloprotease [Chloroflexota bacterium]|nr:CPBP family intramembrane metalloprotease [Chloroflexota bacterium]
MADVIVNLVVVLFFIVLANVIVRLEDDRLCRLFDLGLLLIGIPVLLVGVFFVLAGNEQVAQMRAPTGELLFPFVTNAMVLGVVLQVTAVWQITISLRSTRVFLARFLPVNPASAVHMLALVCAGWLVAVSLIQLTQSSVAEIVEAIGTLELSSVVWQGVLFVLVALSGVGLFIRRSPQQAITRLGLERLTGSQVLIGLAWIMVLVLVQALAGALWWWLNPDESEQIQTLNLQLQAGLDSVWAWLALALATGISEEILFRGALQPVLGLWVTAVLFALVHVQYGLLTPATLALLIIGLVLGILRQRHNTTLAIFVHAGYNFALGLMALLAGVMGV